MSKHKTGKEKRRRRRTAKRAERRASGVEIISQSSQQIGGVTVTFTIGSIHPSKESNDGR